MHDEVGQALAHSEPLDFRHLPTSYVAAEPTRRRVSA
jgi:hypothetical protein